jgi:hypothetical protein
MSTLFPIIGTSADEFGVEEVVGASAVSFLTNNKESAISFGCSNVSWRSILDRLEVAMSFPRLNEDCKPENIEKTIKSVNGQSTVPIFLVGSRRLGRIDLINVESFSLFGNLSFIEHMLLMLTNEGSSSFFESMSFVDHMLMIFQWRM